ncbi:hypothetical protein [Pontibacter chitinilyticus]|uniref:hypothetical protein n=1 Tax=Pontibacter chitinilyticus TaxID=2674989 RepID=UPI00321B14D9
MKNGNLFLLVCIALLVACSKDYEQKTLYPSKMLTGNTTYEFFYNNGRVYSETTTAPSFYEAAEYLYYDDYFDEPEHPFKDKIFEIRSAPDNGPTGWDKSDSIRHKSTMLTRSDTGLIEREEHGEYFENGNLHDFARNKYNAEGQLTECTHYIYDTSYWSERQLNDPQYISKRVTYTYAQGKLAKAAYFAPGSGKPYLQLELKYDDMPGYLSNIPLEARFLPLELPYRAHNLTSYTVRGAQGAIRKDLSYTCSYTYNKYGYPTEFTRKMLDGKVEKGSFTYKTTITDLKQVANSK